ncbi:MAG: hypothetical protein HZB19_03150 [Chloroflexi bacterium]|nr:hypothetical protein [Chloroflexota bacterium]
MDEYDRLSELYREAYDRVQSGGTGAGWSGIHYELMDAVRRYGKTPNSRDEAIRLLKELLNEHEKTYLGARDQTDEEYLSKFDDL